MEFSEFKYERLDYDVLKKQYEELLEKLGKCENASEFMKVFDEINLFRGHTHTMQTLCSVRHTIDTSDEYYDKENEYWDNTMPKLQAYEVQLGKMMLESPFRKETDIPEAYYLSLENQLKSFSPQIIEDLQEENRLVTEYGKLKSSAKIEFEGNTYNLASIAPFMNDNDDREIRKKAVIAYNRFFEENEEKFDEIYDKLVKLRDRMAKKLGFENFIPLGYLRMNRLDYDQKMVKNYRDQVIEDIVPLTVDLRKKQAARIGVDKLECYDLGYNFKTGNPKPHGTLDELVDSALKMYKEMSKETGEFFQTMVDSKLFDLPTRPNKEMGGYCTGFYDYKVPFIFANTNGTSGDVDVLTHEAGHAFQAYCTFKNVTVPDLMFPTMESAEIDSMSMEFFAHPWSHLFFKEEALKYHYFHISEALKFLPYGCLVDHFQHEVYAHPEMTADERKVCWRRLEKVYKPDVEYEGFDLLERGGFFFRQGHIFQVPFYYIDYTLAQVCALQFFVRMLNKDEDAWKDYVHICGLGGTKTFTQIVREANLKVPFEDGCLKEVSAKMKEELDSVDDTKF
ncbi:MAG: M3 family oligoendopeptidase [Erysipelotrichaceae bacterium]|nr:M3 family oligoendopeptidase [Erysipelotrichaceae bacterium]